MSLKTWEGTKWVDTAAAHIHDTYLQLIGGTMTGDITLAGDPTQPLHPATKQYVDGIQAGLHTIATLAPAGPNVGDVWVNPDAVDENAYLPLNGSVSMLGPIVFDLGDTPDGFLEGTDGIGRSVFTIAAGVLGGALQARIQLYGPADTSAPNAINYYAEDHVFNILDTSSANQTVINVDGVNLKSGSEAAPSLVFKVEPTTGMYYRGAAHIGFSILGVGKFRFDSGNAKFAVNVLPQTSGGYNLGSSGNRWATVYSVNADNISSRAATKENIREAPSFSEMIDAYPAVLWDVDDRVAAGFTVEMFEQFGMVDGWTPAKDDGLIYTELVVPMWQELRSLRERMAAMEAGL